AEGTEHGEPIYTVYPRSFVVIGMISEFFDADGNEKKKLITSFELYRRDLLRPEVITFDELLERARHLASPSMRDGSHKSEADGELNR
ncbi:MAG: Shedu anti-phage system protein SduA domain-containing protein, partial [bacterium]